MAITSSLKDYSSLLKYPVIMVTAILGFLFLKCCSGIPFDKFTNKILDSTSSVSKFGFGSFNLEFQQRQVKAAADLHSGGVNLSGSQATDSNYETVPSSIAALAKVDDNGSSVSVGLEGYIWLGNYDPSTGWSHIQIKKIGETGDETSLSHALPSELKELGKIQVIGNMVLRQASPADSPNYFHSVPSVGVLPSGSKVHLLDEPILVRRPSVSQYWAHVHVDQ